MRQPHQKWRVSWRGQEWVTDGGALFALPCAFHGRWGPPPDTTFIEATLSGGFDVPLTPTAVETHGDLPGPAGRLCLRPDGRSVSIDCMYLEAFRGCTLRQTAVSLGCVEATREGRVMGYFAPLWMPGPGPLSGVVTSVQAWQRTTFPHATPESCAAHLLRETEELRRNPTDAMELADCLFLLIGIADRAGMDLAAALSSKLRINKSRTWGPPDADGVVEHVRGEES